MLGSWYSRFAGARSPMARLSKSHVSKRRFPRQERARATLAAILTAATRILATSGSSGFNTNRVAETAGVSIGTLYQYFADKEAILVAIARSYLMQDRRALLQVIGQRVADPEVPVERLAIRETIRIYQVQPAVRRLAMERMIGLGLSDEVGATVQEVGGILAGRLVPRSAGGGPDWTMRLRMATHAADAVIRASAYEEAPYLGTAAFEDAMVRMVWGVLPELESGLGRS